jgi:protease-4
VHQHSGTGQHSKFLLIEVDGLITLGDESSWVGTSRESTVARIREILDAARSDVSVRGLLLRIDSPGGSATASDLVYSELMRFKRDRELPIVAHFLGMAASGGYYVAMAADEIVAEPTAVTGSIGVIFSSVNVSGLMEKWGIEDQTITAGRYKDAGSMLRPQTAEEREILQSVIDDLFDRFRGVVDAGRPKLGRERVDELADGRLYSADQALANGLIDRVGGIEDAVAALETRAGSGHSTVVSYHRQGEWRRNLYTRAAPASPEFGSSDVSLADWFAPGFHFLWPGALSLPDLTH